MPVESDHFLRGAGALLGSFATVACGLLMVASPISVYGHGEADEELVEHFDEHLDDFEEELHLLSERVDAVVNAYAEGEPTDEPFAALIEEWERVHLHEVVETKVTHLYPAIWQGIFAMKQAAEASASMTEMARAGERTKGALWQGLGGLRVLAKLPGKTAPTAPDNHGAPGTFQINNHLELTGDDDMQFDKSHFVVAVGEPITLQLRNIGQLPKDVMGHNVVVLERGTDIEPFGVAAGEAPENDFIPTEREHVESIVAHTELLGPGEVAEITFTLEEPGEYPFICSFIAHFRQMSGTIEAVIDPSAQPVEAILAQLESAVDAYIDGEGERAEALVHSAYMNIFEGLEGDLIEKNPDLVLELELDFNAKLPSLFQEGAPAAEARAQVGTMRERLELAKELLAEVEAERTSIFD